MILNEKVIGINMREEIPPGQYINKGRIFDIDMISTLLKWNNELNGDKFEFREICEHQTYKKFFNIHESYFLK